MASNIEHYQRGYAYYNDGEFVKAIEEYTEAIKLDTDDQNIVPVYCLRGIAYKDRGRKNNNKSDFELAIMDFTIIIQFMPNTIAYLNVGVYHMAG